MQRRSSQFRTDLTSEIMQLRIESLKNSANAWMEIKFFQYFRSVNHCEPFDSHAEQEASSSLRSKTLYEKYYLRNELAKCTFNSALFLLSTFFVFISVATN